MPKQPTEPESYSVDEMLARLRDGEREKEEQSTGELVTRPDGTQVMRVRKRKRRSQQEEKKPAPERKRNPLLWVLGVVALLVVGLGIAMVVLLARYNSSGFRTGMETALTEATGADATFEGLAVTPFRARSKNLVVEWGKERSLQSLSLSGLSAELDFASFLSGNWTGVEAFSQSGEMIIGGTSVAGGGPRRADLPSLFAGYRCEFLDIYLGSPGKGIQFKNTELGMRAGPEGETQFHLRGGDTVIPGWSVMATDRGMAEVVDGGLKLISLRMRSKTDEGEISFSSDSILQEGEDIDLTIRVDRLPLSSFVGKDFGRMMDGVVSCESGSLTLDGATLQDVGLRMEFSGTSCFIYEFPFLEVLRTRLADSEFVKPYFKSARGTLLRDRNGLRIQDLQLMEKSQMAVRGQIAATPQGELSGRLEVGIAEAKIITATNRKRSSVFSDPMAGFCWVTVELSGTVEEPMDDFQDQLRKAAHEESPRNREKMLEERLEELTR